MASGLLLSLQRDLNQAKEDLSRYKKKARTFRKGRDALLEENRQLRRELMDAESFICDERCSHMGPEGHCPHHGKHIEVVGEEDREDALKEFGVIARTFSPEVLGTIP